jgi:hypothetical protein
MTREHLGTYLNDHLTGFHVAIEILDHLVAETSAAPAIAGLRSELDEDRHELKVLMNRLHIVESRVRKAGSWIAEGLSELKLEVDDEPNGPLRRLERLEQLAIGIQGKVALWKALDVALGSHVEPGNLDYPRLIHRGQEQYDQVETLRLEAARAALVL